jgi:primosomal protein N' (replication factor Y)
MAGSVARVAIDSPLPQLDRLFDYSIPESLRETAVPGVRVRVPLRSAGRVADGWLVELGEAGDFELSPLEAVVSPVQVLRPEVWTLARRAADRAAGAATDVLRIAIPGRQARVEKAWLARGEEAALPSVPTREVEQYAGLAAAVTARERLAVDAIPLVAEVRVDGKPEWVGQWAITMAQAAVVSIAAGDSAILCVPDYRDQRQLELALAALLPPERIVHLDARQPNPDRYRAFLRCIGPEPLAIVGNRSVVYAPAERLGLIAIFDDGDPLHAEPLAPYVNARDAALLRQEQQGAALLLVGHSRSTEAERLVEVGWLRAMGPDRPFRPKVVPTAQQAGGDRLAELARIPSSAWRTAREALESGPVLVQVARPGYAPGLACADCGQTARCQRCEGPLVRRTASSPPGCAWCGALAVGWSCSNCGGTKLVPVGSGATRTAEDLGRAFPGTLVIIADGERTVLTVPAKPALVIATRGAEPIADGGYRAVLLLDGERMVQRESLRVAEDCLRWWSNATALAARGAATVLVGVGGALATALATWRQPEFARQELDDRRRLRFPPAVRVATITGALEAVQKAAAATSVPEVDVLGPVDLPAGTVREILRFDYARGAEVAAELRAAVVRAASARRAATKGRLDDVEPFLDL